MRSSYQIDVKALKMKLIKVRNLNFLVVPCTYCLTLIKDNVCKYLYQKFRISSKSISFTDKTKIIVYEANQQGALIFCCQIQSV